MDRITFTDAEHQGLLARGCCTSCHLMFTDRCWRCCPASGPSRSLHHQHVQRVPLGTGRTRGLPAPGLQPA
jgi:hypothetical protein